MKRSLFSVLALTPCLLFGQRPPADAPARAFESTSLEYSFSSDESLNRQGPAGSVAVHHTEFNAGGRRTLSASDTLSFGLMAQSSELESSAGTWLPERLNAVAFSLGLSRRLSDRWSASFTVRPGLYGDFADIDAKTFNAPLLLGGTYASRRELVWLFGLRADVHAEHPVLPFVGVRWQFAPEWSVAIAFPRSGVQWRPNDNVTVDAGIRLQGGTFRITEQIGGFVPGRGRLANTFVDYSEVRVGLGAETRLHRGLVLRAEAGAFVDREFDFFDRDYTLDGEGGVYGSLALRAEF